MSFILFLSDSMIPIVLVLIVVYGWLKKVELFKVFVEGAKDGFKTIYNIAPTLIGLIVAVGVIRASGALDIFSIMLAPITNLIGFPIETVPLMFMRLISSSASVGLILDLFKTFGPDSFIGRFVSVMMVCTETVFYTMSVYFMSIGIRKTRYTLPAAIFVNVFGIFAAYYITLIVFGYV